MYLSVLYLNLMNFFHQILDCYTVSVKNEIHRISDLTESSPNVSSASYLPGIELICFDISSIPLNLAHRSFYFQSDPTARFSRIFPICLS